MTGWIPLNIGVYFVYVKNLLIEVEISYNLTNLIVIK